MSNPTERSFFFLGGAPKCGTSSLFDLLSFHPGITPSSPKETFYVVDRENPHYRRHGDIYREGWKGFSKFFPTGSDHPENILLEGTTQLIYQKEIHEYIKELKDLKVAFIFREPARRILSAYEFARYNHAAFVKELPFADYIEILMEGNPQTLDRYIQQPTVYFLRNALSASTYHIHVSKWMNWLGKDRILVLQFENFRKDNQATLDQICNWLSIPTFVPPQEAFDPKNKSLQPKNQRLHHWVKRIGKSIPGGGLKKLVKNLYLSNQMQEIKRKAPVEQELRVLKSYYREHNEKLAQLAEIDLSLWE